MFVHYNMAGKNNMQITSSKPMFTSYIVSHSALHRETYTRHQQRQIHCTNFISSHATFLWMLNTFIMQVSNTPEDNRELHVLSKNTQQKQKYCLGYKTRT
jgi:hypothetical protein